MSEFIDLDKLTQDVTSMFLEPVEKKKVVRQVVRLTTSYWSDGRGTHCKKSLRTMQRLSNSDWVDEEISCGGPDCFWESITNLHECKDGLYVVDTCHESRDWESGHIDGYDYVLVPFVAPGSSEKSKA